MLILRKCKKNGLSSRNFYYGNTGDTVESPEWNSNPFCGNGLHGLKEGNGNWSLLQGDDWLVIEANEEDVVDIDNEKCKFKKGKIIYRGDKKGLMLFADKFQLNSTSAFQWASNVGNYDIMIQKINGSDIAYYWATNIGNKDVMIDKINDSYFAYLWALNIGNHEIMIEKINESYHAYLWARYIGNRDIMAEKITDSYDAYFWALLIGNHEIMVDKIDSAYYASMWIKDIGNNDILFEKFPGLESNKNVT